MQRHGWSTRWGDEGPQDEERVTTEAVSQAGCCCSMCACKSAVKPLIVIQYRDTIATRHTTEISKMMFRAEAQTGYKCLIVGGMDEAKVQVFGVDAPGLETLTLDEVIDMLESLKRMREETSSV